ncbi:DUF6993 domain-containing protein [Leifsonia sp. 2MCAF36]|uniref:DUF6993 domain-containing protein n=1 Tax=Leifsonia sp. 2MCAF36 TaxID=3232988 RepID=UPI003F9A2AFA
MTLLVVRRTGPFAGIPVAAVGAMLAVVFALTGCTGAPGPGASRSSSATAHASAEATPSAGSSAPAAVALVPGGTAEQNLPFFDQVNKATLAANPDAKGRDFIDALVSAGFDKSSMQVTVDTTTIGLKANSIQFSVRMGEACLIGQNGADAGGYSSMVTPVLSTGNCLIGQTRAIDW